MTKGLCSPDRIRNPFHFQVSLDRFFPREVGEEGLKGLQMMGDGAQWHPLLSRPASAFWPPKALISHLRASSDLCPTLPYHLTNVPQSPADIPIPTVWGGSVLTVPTSSPLHVHLGLLEPQLAANRASKHPPVPGSRETRPGPSLPPSAVDQTRGQGMGIPG